MLKVRYKAWASVCKKNFLHLRSKRDPESQAGWGSGTHFHSYQSSVVLCN